MARGLGLGLSIVERIARVLDHRSRSTSTVGRGSRFSVEVPRSSARAGRTAGARPRARSIRASSPASTVLCIDNEPTVLDGMETLLGGWGCEVIKAPDLDVAR